MNNGEYVSRRDEKVVKHFRDLFIYRASFDVSMRIFHLSKSWPADERYSLVDQVRRSSRSVCANIAEAWRKRRYPAHFVSKLTDSDSEVAETQSWLEFARRSGYIGDHEYSELNLEYEKVSAGLVKMMNQKDLWCGPAMLREEKNSSDSPSFFSSPFTLSTLSTPHASHTPHTFLS